LLKMPTMKSDHAIAETGYFQMNHKSNETLVFRGPEFQPLIQYKPMLHDTCLL
jgi:hypothetical protein